MSPLKNLEEKEVIRITGGQRRDTNNGSRLKLKSLLQYEGETLPKASLAKKAGQNEEELSHKLPKILYKRDGAPSQSVEGLHQPSRMQLQGDNIGKQPSGNRQLERVGSR